MRQQSARSRHSPRIYLGFGGAYRAGDDSYRYAEYQTEAEALELAHQQACEFMIKRLRMGYLGPNHPPQLRMV